MYKSRTHKYGFSLIQFSEKPVNEEERKSQIQIHSRTEKWENARGSNHWFSDLNHDDQNTA